MSTAVKRKNNKETYNKDTTQKGWTINFSGRLNRRQYFFGLFLVPLVSWFPIFVVWAIVKLIETVFGLMITDGIISILFLVLPMIACTVLGSSVFLRRHHDLNQSGYVFLLIIAILILIMIINSQLASALSSLYSLYLLFFSGNNSSNRYGLESDSKSVMQIIGLKK